MFAVVVLSLLALLAAAAVFLYVMVRIENAHLARIEEKGRVIQTLRAMEHALGTPESERVW